jgi:hypothetical protein
MDKHSRAAPGKGPMAIDIEQFESKMNLGDLE